MTDELKPCAHCNHDAKFVREIQMSPESPVLGYILCPNCGMRTGCMLLYSEAIAVWNSRHNVLDSVDNLSLMAESVRRGLAEVQADDLPSWVKEAIEKDILNSQENLERSAYLKNKMSDSNWISRINAMNWMLNLRKPEVK